MIPGSKIPKEISTICCALFLFPALAPFGSFVFGMDEDIDFELKNISGKTISFQEQYGNRDAIVITFIGTECPLVKLYTKRLNQFAKEFEKNVAFVAIDSNQHDSIEELQAFARRHETVFEILKDPGNKIADRLGATRTPETFVLNKNFKVCYQGAIDDQFTYGIQKRDVKRQYLRDAIKSLLRDTEIAVTKTEPIGCIIGRRLESDSSSEVTFHNQISRILQAKCLRCHRQGDLAPFALEEYEEVVGWAGMIEEVVRERRMPPWHAEAEPGYFKNDCRLTNEEKNLIYRWVNAGAPAGDISNAPAKRQFAQGWQIGPPDQIIKMRDRPFNVPAQGVVEYQYFVVDPKFKEDKWIKAAECRPGNRQVVHHIIVGIKGHGEFGRNRSEALESEWLAATAPGAPPMILPAGYAKFVPAGSKLIFQMHYTPNGTKQKDVSEIGLVFANPNEVNKQVMTLMSFNDHLKIPPGVSNHRVTSRYTLDQDVELISMFPHMHYRGKNFSYQFKRPGGSFETLLNVPYYDFNWQNAYELSKFKALPKGTRLRCIAHFDNSEENLANPNPDQTVRWGDQTWEEMMIGYFDVAVDLPKSR